MAISVEHISKVYRLGSIGGAMLSDDLARWWARLRGQPDPLLKVGQVHHARRTGEQFWALDDVSFEVKEGEALGIIGGNGAGKSTLLKILSQVTAPTAGQIRIRGRIASLLEVGTGFHPELTGRENIFLNGAILGMTKSEIRRKFDEIVAFSECEEFIDTPVKRYSSGMYVRLAFAVAAHLEPEILIIDEVLAVGDAKFQKKCLGKMGEASRGGRTVLFVSHNMGAISRLCGRSVLLKGGQVSFVGDSALAIEEYLGGKEASQGAWMRAPGTTTSSGISLQEVRITNAAGKVTGDLASTEPVELVIVVHASGETQPLQVAFSLTNHEGVVVFSSASTDHRGELRALPIGYHEYRVAIPANFLSPGSYSLTVVAHIPRVVLFDIVEAITFNIAHTATGIPDDRSGVVRPLLDWRHSAGVDATYQAAGTPLLKL